MNLQDQILNVIKAGYNNIGELVEKTGCSKKAIKQELSILENKGILEPNLAGTAWCVINHEVIEQIIPIQATQLKAILSSTGNKYLQCNITLLGSSVTCEKLIAVQTLVSQLKVALEVHTRTLKGNVIAYIVDLPFMGMVNQTQIAFDVQDLEDGDIIVIPDDDYQTLRIIA